MEPPTEREPTERSDRTPAPAEHEPTQRSDRTPVRASDQERDAIVQRLQGAFVEGRIDDAEFDERMRAALTARTRTDLDNIVADLPAASVTISRVPTQTTGKLILAMKGGVTRAGRWRVPERCNAVAYKGDCELDLRAAELTAGETSITAVSYKGRVEILVPPGVRLDVHGWSYGGQWADRVPDDDLPPDAPVVHVRAIVYKGVVEARTTPARGQIAQR
jgi:uncharacterized protein DUF1707